MQLQTKTIYYYYFYFYLSNANTIRDNHKKTNPQGMHTLRVQGLWYSQGLKLVSWYKSRASSIKWEYRGSKEKNRQVFEKSFLVFYYFIMKEIKFRAWDKISRYMEDFDLNRIYWRWEKTGDYYFPWEGIVIMQYTWLLDKNWVEIYEGDILDMYNKWVVTFYQWRFTVFYNWWTEEEIENRSWWFYSVLVIGNIYENPELLD